MSEMEIKDQKLINEKTSEEFSATTFRHGAPFFGIEIKRAPRKSEAQKAKLKIILDC